MPEGPEVQVIVDGLQPMVGQRIRGLYRGCERVHVMYPDFLKVLGRRISTIRRVGKFIVWDFDNSSKLLIHLSFTGHFSYKPASPLVCKFYFDAHKPLCFSDKRGLAKLRFLTEEQYLNNATLNAHKVDALDSSQEEILDRLQSLHGRVKKQLKPFLLDYNYICGIGNIYGSEICFHAGLSPFISFSDLTEEDLLILSKSIKFIIQRAYLHGGSSIESFSDLSDKEGHAQDYHKVYHKVVCVDCGSRIERAKQSMRSTFYCRHCQNVKEEDG